MILLLVLCIVNLVCRAQNFVQKGLDIDGEAADDLSGWSVSMPDKHTVAIGSRWNDGINGSNSGHVRIYRWNVNNGGFWEQKGMDIDGEAAYDISGWSVSMPDSNVVAIGAYQNDGNWYDAGNVRIYRWSGSAWVQKGLDIDGEVQMDYSGYSVSMPDSNTVAIGAYFNDGNGNNSGHVRIYHWNGITWTQKGSDIDGEYANDESGSSVSMPDSNTVAIGAIFNDGNGFNSGHGRIYRWNGNVWVQKGNDIDGEAAADQSGVSVSMPDSNTIAIGAMANAGNGFNSGHARIFHWNGNAWVQKGNDIDGEVAEDLSGLSVSMPDSNTVAISAIANDGNGFDAGHVRIFRWNGIAWIQKGIDIDGEAMYDQSGYSISMPDSNTIAIGAPRNNGSGNLAGHTRVYSFCSPVASTFSVSSCFSYTWPLDSTTYTNSTNGPAVTLLSTEGCDSVVTLNLTINTVDVSVSNNSPTLTANATGAAYQWLDCGNGYAIIPSEINQNFTATQNGSYAVEISQNNCIDTSACEAVINLTVLESNFENALLVYPNPAMEDIRIDLQKKYEDINIVIRNVLGQIILKKSYSASNVLQLNIPGKSGVYYIEVRSGDSKAVLKVMKE